MRDFNERNATEAVLAQMAGCPDPRLRTVMASIVRHLHEVVQETEPTEAEWLAAIEFLTAVGKRADARRQEFIILSDVLGVSALVDAIAHRGGPGVTESTVLGPFHLEGASPDLPHGAAICGKHGGEPTVVTGRVLDSTGKPLPDAAVEVWQSDADGFYDVQRREPGAALDSRGRFRTGAEGEFWFRTVKPVSYPIPTDGPVGQLLRALGRPMQRPAHLHFIITAPGHPALTTQVFVEGDPCLDSDPVFGVKQSLIATFEQVDDPAQAERWHVPSPFCRMHKDFVLA